MARVGLLSQAELRRGARFLGRIIAVDLLVFKMQRDFKHQRSKIGSKNYLIYSIFLILVHMHNSYLLPKSPTPLLLPSLARTSSHPESSGSPHRPAL
jgi:hypothetical protein